MDFAPEASTPLSSVNDSSVRVAVVPTAITLPPRRFTAFMRSATSGATMQYSVCISRSLTEKVAIL